MPPHADPTTPPKWLAGVPALAGLLVQAWVWHRGGYDSAWDDMAITAAFARTFSETGRIALTPSSEIVEGFSTPLWFFVLAAVRTLFSLDAHALYRAAQLLSSFLLDATLLLLGLTVLRLGAARREAAWAVAALSLLALWPPFVRESVNGMENPLIALVLVWGAWWAGARPVVLAMLGVLLVWLRVEGGLFVLPLALVGRSRRVFLAVAGAAALAFLAQEAWRYVTFGELVPNTILAKLHPPYSVPGPLKAMLIARVRYLPVAAPLVFLPLVLVFARRWTRDMVRRECRPGGALDSAVLGAFVSAAVLTLLVGREWGYPGRMIFALNVLGLSGLILATARSSPPALRAGVFLACAVLVGRDAWRFDHAAPNGDIITVRNYRASNAEPLTRLAAAANRSGLIIATPDVGGTSLFGPTHTIVDTGLLSNRRLAKLGYGALAEEVFGDRVADVIDTHTVFTRVSGIREGRPLQALLDHYVPVSLDGKVFYVHRRLLASLPASRVAAVPGWEARGPRRSQILGRAATYSRLDLELLARFPTVYVVELEGLPS